MSTLFIDWETDFNEKAGLTLKKMALRAYLREAPIQGFSFAIDNGPFNWVDAKNPDFLGLCAEISDFGLEPGNVVAAYNAPFDCRVGRFGRLTRGGEPLGMEWPETIHDAMEFAMAAWPNMPGGYSLRNVAAWLHLPPKLSIQDVLAGKVSWETYCNRDGELLREIYLRAIKRLSPEELFYAENCNRVRGIAYTINDQTVASSLAAFTANTEAGVEAAVKFLSSYARDGEDLGGAIFGGFAEGKVRSVKAKALKELLISALGFATTSTSLKKINPSHLAQRPDVAELLRSTTKANKGLYYQKRTTALVGASEMDMEKGYFRATNTGRTSAPTVGRGVNCLTGDTPIHTSVGLKRLDSVLNDDLVWDGIEFVPHGGLVYRGQRTCLTVAGLRLTPDHRILTSLGWRTAQWVAHEPTITLQDSGLGLGSSSAQPPPPTPIAFATAVTAALKGRLSRTPSSRAGSASVARYVPASVATKSSPTTPCGGAGSNGGTGSSNGSSTRGTPSTDGMEAEGSPWTLHGPLTPPCSSPISPPSPTTKEPSQSRSSTPSTGSTTTETTSPATSGSLMSRPTTGTRSTFEPVYDLLDCGPRARFVAGSVIVHNCANLTKKDKTIAKPLRQMLALPDHLCYVRIDAANVEYRVNGLLTDCDHICRLFQNDLDADPYSAFVLEGFGVRCKKGEPMRDVVGKAAVLGYGFGMGTMRAIEEFNKSVADPINKVSVREIEALCFERGWGMPTSRYLKGAVTRVGCHWSIAVAANEARDAFHALHPEIFATADWLVRSVEMLAGSKDPERLLEVLYGFSGAPDRDKLALSIDRELEFPTVRVTLFGHSIPTVTWRHLSVSHPGVDGLGAVTANKGPRRFHRALAIENVVQSSARIGLMRCENEFTRRTGWLTDSVYDEILAIVPRDRDAILTARREMVDIMSPHGPHGMGWAFYGKPAEVTVTRTRYEDEGESKTAFAKLEANDPTWKEHLH